MAHATPTITLPTVSENRLPMPTLNPKINRPVGVAVAVGAWKRLQRIERIEVMLIGDASVNESLYTINVFLHHTRNHIPVNNLRSTTSATTYAQSAYPRTTPDLQIVRSFSELTTLRQSVRSSVRQYHPVYCELCDSLAMRMLTKLAQPYLMSAAICLSSVKGAKQIRAYLDRVLAHLGAKKDRCAPTCKAQRELPLLLHNFLFGGDLG